MRNIRLSAVQLFLCVVMLVRCHDSHQFNNKQIGRSKRFIRPPMGLLPQSVIETARNELQPNIVLTPIKLKPDESAVDDMEADNESPPPRLFGLPDSYYLNRPKRPFSQIPIDAMPSEMIQRIAIQNELRAEAEAENAQPLIFIFPQPIESVNNERLIKESIEAGTNNNHTNRTRAYDLGGLIENPYLPMCDSFGRCYY